MTDSAPTDGALPITTSSARAAALYRTGVERYLGRSDTARATFEAAVAEDGDLAVALAAVALASAPASSPIARAALMSRALRAARAATRRERQHVEIVGFFAHGELSHARALGAAHLAEFPADALIAYLVADR